MAVVNYNSIFSKCKAWSETPSGKARMKETMKSHVRNNVKASGCGDKIVTKDDMITAAYALIDILRNTASGYGLAPSVAAHLESLSATEPYELSDGSYEIGIYFTDNLHRDSLQPEKYGGVDNIVALINNGYGHHDSIEHVWGEWRGNWIHGLSERQGLHFIQQAVDDFNGNYGSGYRATAIAGEDYE